MSLFLFCLIAIDCGHLAAPMNGSIFGNKTVFPNSKTFQCDNGFDLIGSSLRACLSNGNWSGKQTSCKGE
jgi:CUB/sushi domain-containing protein